MKPSYAREAAKRLGYDPRTAPGGLGDRLAGLDLDNPEHLLGAIWVLQGDLNLAVAESDARASRTGMQRVVPGLRRYPHFEPEEPAEGQEE